MQCGPGSSAFWGRFRGWARGGEPVRWSAGLHECRVRAPGMSNSGPVESRDFLGNLGALGAHLSALWGRMFGILGANTPICTSRRSSSRYGTVCGFVENRAGEPHRLRHGESGCDTDLCTTWASPASCGHGEGKGCATTQGRLAQRGFRGSSISEMPTNQPSGCIGLGTKLSRNAPGRR